MKKNGLKIIALLLALVMTVSLAACGGGQQQEKMDPDALFEALLENVAYETEISDIGETARVFFLTLPETAQVKVYSGSGYFADELVMITLESTSDMDAAKLAVQEHLKQMREQFISYIPGEVTKIDNAQLWVQDVNLILCITGDHATASAIMSGESVLDQAPTEDGTVPSVTEDPEQTQPTTEPPTEGPTEPSKELNANGYPAIISQNDYWTNYDAAVVVDNMAYEYYNYNSGAANSYAALVNKVAQDLAGEVAVYDLVIPTAIGIVFPDNIAEKYSVEDQGARLDQIYSLMNEHVIPVNVYENMMQHRDEYLYFRTDWHWSGIGAYYAYETFCQVKGVTPYTMEQRQCSQFEGYLGPLYTGTCNYDSAVGATPDTVYAYHPYHQDTTMKYTDTKGNVYSWPVIMDVSDYGSGLKYMTFAAGDQPFAEFHNPGVTDGSVAIVVKESFGNALMPYVVDHYSTVYEIDYRYWSGNLVDYARQVGADDILFANNIGMVRSSYLVGLLDRII